jgi:isochorismate synthase EntC
VLLETANVWHLSTRFRGRLLDPVPSALELTLALHPTPAIGGSPTDAALAAIGQLEGFARGAYAGPVGWVDGHGNGVWAIALRCALLSDDHATLYAGAGIVAASDPADELDETDRKFRPFLDALRWG